MGSNPFGGTVAHSLHCSAFDFRWPCDISEKIVDLSQKLPIYLEKSPISRYLSRNIAGPIFLHEISCQYPSIHDISSKYCDIFFLGWNHMYFLCGLLYFLCSSVNMFTLTTCITSNIKAFVERCLREHWLKMFGRV